MCACLVLKGVQHSLFVQSSFVGFVKKICLFAFIVYEMDTVFRPGQHNDNKFL